MVTMQTIRRRRNRNPMLSKRQYGTRSLPEYSSESNKTEKFNKTNMYKRALPPAVKH